MSLKESSRVHGGGRVPRRRSNPPNRGAAAQGAQINGRVSTVPTSIDDDTSIFAVKIQHGHALYLLLPLYLNGPLHLVA